MRTSMTSASLIACCASIAACGGGEAFTPVTTGKNLKVAALTAEEGCQTCMPNLLEGVLGRQTPSELKAGILSVELLRSPFDIEPHLLMQSDQPIVTDLVAGATFVDVDVGSIPPGSYPLMRVTLANTRFAVDATAHVPFSGGDHAGALAVDYALSDYDDAELGPRAQGEYHADFDSPDFRMPLDASQPVNWPAPYPGAFVDTTGGQYRVTFLSPEAVNVSHSMPQAVDVGVTFHIDDAFSWAEREGALNQLGTFDLSPNPLEGETPVSLGISGFSIQVLAVAGEPVGGDGETPAGEEPAASDDATAP
ncbi:MAG: hypothetical protein A2138_01480 [Deltaproteobacteria bacterium RBG_16_71_12]|nr:MAG: hypothetical protein A2138_01480 [Deltaproteobacteria bacterium RBG_16_71_12]